MKALELAGVLTWQNRIARIRERCRDLFGRVGWRWRVIRTSNAYVLTDPASKSDQRTGTQIETIHLYRLQPLTRTARWNVPLPDSPRPSPQRTAANKSSVARTEPQNPAKEANMTEVAASDAELERQTRAPQ